MTSLYDEVQTPTDDVPTRRVTMMVNGEKRTVDVEPHSSTRAEETCIQVRGRGGGGGGRRNGGGGGKGACHGVARGGGRRANPEPSERKVEGGRSYREGKFQLPLIGSDPILYGIWVSPVVYQCGGP